jgi:dihydroneopterin aldolase
MDFIELDTLRIDCIVGILERERREPQPIEIGLRLGLDLQIAAERGLLDRSVDYAAVADRVTTLATEGRFLLIETMALAIARLLLSPPAPQEGRAALDRVEVRIRKPEVLDRRAVPGVFLAREASLPMETRVWRPGVLMDVLHEMAHNASYRLHVDAGAAFDIPPSYSLQILAGEFTIGDRVLRPGDRLARGAMGTLENRGRRTACVLAVAFPGPV